MLISACSRKNLIGSYVYVGGARGATVKRSLVLKKDSTFEYSDFKATVVPPDEIRIHDAVGKGKFALNGKNLILNFSYKIRDVNKVDIIPAMYRELGINDEKSNATDSVFLKFHIYFTNSVDDSANPPKNFYTSVTVNGREIDNDHPLMGLKKNIFPLELNLDFSMMSWPSVSEDSRFIDKKIKIEKAGNYQVNIHLFKLKDPLLETEIIFNRQILPLTYFMNSITIDGMKRAKKDDNNVRKINYE
ncbi:hypothetical protein [Mucilaginibacter sp.]|nr:hypothetical protein [Mucilaginibacter sp.]